MAQFIYEHFDDVYQFDKTLNERKVNKIFAKKAKEGSLASKRLSEWNGTETFDEAEKLLIGGWNCKIDEMMTELKKFSRNVSRTRQKTIKSVSGFAPCVPNALRGVPKSMFSTKKVSKQEKSNVVKLVYNPTADRGMSADELMKRSLTFLKMCVLLEAKGIKTSIVILPIVSFAKDSIVGCGVKIKDYQQPFNLLKIAYPVGHISFFRRHGFRWIETVPNLKEKKFEKGYGNGLSYIDQDVAKRYLNDYVKLSKDVVYIDVFDVKNCDYNPEFLIKKILSI